MPRALHCLVLTILALLATACQQPDLTATQSEPPVYAKANAPEFTETPYVLLISIDGYRADYTNLYAPPNLTRFASEGVRAESLVPAFPSDTFPNHYGIVTGMFPGTHGIVANSFLDPERDALYRLGDSTSVNDGTWYGGVPVWSVAEDRGMVTASYFWVGSEAEIAGHRPTYRETYDSTVPHKDRIAQVLRWLAYPPEYRPHFITLYFSSVDTAGHADGPDSDTVRQAVLDIDRDLGTLFSGLEAIDPSVDVFIVSDHGMVATDPEEVIRIDEVADLDRMRTVNSGSRMFLYGNDPAATDAAYRSLQAGENHYRVFRNGETPEAWHAGNRRFGDIIVAADAPWMLVGGDAQVESPGGTHGYDPYLYPEVRGIFYARGPDIRNDLTIPPVGNVHIYPLILDLLGFESPDGVDGRLEVLEGILR